MTTKPSPARSMHPPARLAIEPTALGQRAWYCRAEHDARSFLLHLGHRLSDPSLADWVVEQCAELVWESRATPLEWSALPIQQVWSRLGNLHRFFPQPRLVIAFHETLHLFLPWLVSAARLTPACCEALLDQLDAAQPPMLERARAQLVRRLHFRPRAR